MKIVGYPNPSASSYWRMKDPFRELRKLGVDARVAQEGITKEALDWADIIYLQSVVDKQGIALCYEYQQTKGKKIWLDLDDWIEPNPDNPLTKEHEDLDAFFTISQTLKIADYISCTTEYLAKKIRGINKNVKVVPNYIYKERFKPEIIKNKTGELRIGYFGSITHKADLDMILEPMKKIMKEYDAKFIQVCDPRIKPDYEDLKMEFVWPVPFEWYPDRIKGLQIDFAVAPLVDNEFNRCKSWIKPLEAGCYGIPTIASDIEPYKALKESAFLVKEKDWYKTMSQMCTLDRSKLGVDIYNTVQTLFLEDHIKEWILW